MYHLLRLGRYVALTIALLLLSFHTALALGPVEDAVQLNTSDCSDGIGLSFTDREFEEALALGGQDAVEFGSSRFACGSDDVDSRTELAQCTDPQSFASFAAASVEPDDWVICLVAMRIDEGGRGFRASLGDYDAILVTGDVVKPDSRVSSWAGNHEDLFNVDLSIEQIFSADSLNYGLLAFPDMPDVDFVLRNRETGNQFVVSARENTIGDLIPIVAAPEVGPIVLTGTDHDSPLWILSLGNPLRVTLDMEDVGNIVSLDAEYRRDGDSILPESESLISVASSYSDPEDFSACPPCEYSHTLEFTPEAGKVFHFKVLADGRWTITVEAIGSGVPATQVPPLTFTPTPTPPRRQPPTETPTALPTWTPTPSPTLTPPPPVIPTPTPSLTPTPVVEEPTPTTESQGGAELLGRLPNAPSLDHADCFGIVDDGTLNFEQLLGRFSGVQDAATRLQGWDWEASAFRQFGCDGPPEGEAGWIDISAHLFGNAVAAQEAVDYFAAVLAEGGPLVFVEPPAIGDHAAALSGPASNGKEFTIYASQGPLLVRVTGVSPSGIPFMNVLTVTQSVLAAQQGQPPIGPTRAAHEASPPASTYLPVIPFVRHRECFEVLTQGTYAYGDVVDALLPTGLSQSQFDELGWQDGVYRVFTCEEPPIGRATQIDVGIHQFQDVLSARQALPYYSSMYDLGENETRSCDAAGTLVICVSGRSLSGSPLSDVHFVLNQVVSGAR